jgi:hypothetical protein
MSAAAGSSSRIVSLRIILENVKMHFSFCNENDPLVAGMLTVKPA